MVHPAFALRSVARANESNAVAESLPQTIPSLSSWHPKISPYRFIVLTTTIGLGTAKAVLTQRGSTFGPITLEWLTGTVIFLVLFSVSAYDAREDAVPPFLCWLFKPDCMNYFWPLLASLTYLERPVYDSREKATIFDPHVKHPPVTPYRVLVCSVVTSFGISKALLGYYGLSTAMTWTDWALAVPVTTCLYLLGLYEYNSLNIWSSFFVEDQSEIFYSVNTGVQHVVGVCVSSAWTLGCAYFLRHTIYSPDWNFKASRPNNYRITLRTLMEDVGNVGLKLLIQEFIVGAILAGLAVLFVLSRSIVRNVVAQGGLVRRTLRTVRRAIFRTVAKFLPWLAEDRDWTSQSSSISFRRYREDFLDSINLLFRVFFHVSLHIFGIVGVLSFSMSLSRIILFILDVIRADPCFLNLGGSIPVLALVALTPLGSLWVTWNLCISMLAPLASRQSGSMNWDAKLFAPA